MADFVPDDVRLGMTQLDANCAEALRWGICGAGFISTDFLLALENIKKAARVVHIGCRDRKRAVKLVEDLGLTEVRCSSGYNDVMSDPDVEIVYIGTVSLNHKDLALAAIENGKHVCVEKPAALFFADVKEIADAAKAKGVLLLENMWTRFFPAVSHLRKCVQDGCIGEVQYVRSEFLQSHGEIDSTLSYFNFELGGGTFQQMACYPVAAVTSVMGTNPLSIKAIGKFRSSPPENNVKVDTAKLEMGGSAIIEFKGGLANIGYSWVVSGTSGLTVVGTKGTIKYGPYCQCPSTVEVELSPENGRTDNGRTNTTKIIDFPLPDIHTHRADSKVKYRFTRSAGLQYSAAALHRCIRAGLLECPQYTTEDMLCTHRILDEMRPQIFGSRIHDM